MFGRQYCLQILSWVFTRVLWSCKNTIGGDSGQVGSPWTAYTSYFPKYNKIEPMISIYVEILQIVFLFQASLKMVYNL